MITILGRGVWGQALSSVLKANKLEHLLWDRTSEVDPKSIVVIALPTQAIREVLTNNKENLKNSIIINTSKGIEKGTHMLPHQIAKEVLGDKIKYLSMSGPSFAVEVEEKLPTMVNLASIDRDTNLEKELQKLFQTDYFRVRIAGSSQAIEMAGAFKNIYAILCGISEGLGFFINTRSQLIGRAFRETAELCEAIGYKIDKDAVECIMGDLVLTCSSLESRNFRFGKYLTKLSVDDALKQVASTVEGKHNALSVPYLSQKSGLKLPFAEFVLETIKMDSPKDIEERFRDVLKAN